MASKKNWGKILPTSSGWWFGTFFIVQVKLPIFHKPFVAHCFFICAGELYLSESSKLSQSGASLSGRGGVHHHSVPREVFAVTGPVGVAWWPPSLGPCPKMMDKSYPLYPVAICYSLLYIENGHGNS